MINLKENLQKYKEKRNNEKIERANKRFNILCIVDFTIMGILLFTCLTCIDYKVTKTRLANSVSANTKAQEPVKNNKEYETYIIDEDDYRELAGNNKTHEIYRNSIEKYVLEKYPNATIYNISGPIKLHSFEEKKQSKEGEQVWVINAINANYDSVVDTEEFLIYVKESKNGDNRKIEVVDQYHRKKADL